jgi:oligopeptide/dipeptide ABC transporter ATP-binding protein
MTDLLLDIQGLEVVFTGRDQAVHAVRGVDFTMGRGEIVGIVGESGCGKSALLSALTRLHPPRTTTLKGQVLYQGNNLLAYSEAKMRTVRGKQIGMIFQDPMTSLNPTLTIGVQLMEGYLHHFPRGHRGDAKKRALQLLEAVELSADLLDRYPHTLSGGMRQRVMIALALMCEPALLLADEPTTALDVTVQSHLLHLLRRIRERTGTAILLITHDLGVLGSLCDRVLVMYAGKLVERAPLSTLWTKAQHPYTRRLLEAIPSLSAPKGQPLPSIPGRPPTLSGTLHGCAFAPRCAHATERCKNEEPPLYSVHGHASACFLHEDLSS